MERTKDFSEGLSFDTQLRTFNPKKPTTTQIQFFPPSMVRYFTEREVSCMFSSPAASAVTADCYVRGIHAGNRRYLSDTLLSASTHTWALLVRMHLI